MRFLLTRFLTNVHLIIMQMMRDLWPVCHALLKKKNEKVRSDVCCAHRPEAN